MGALKKAKRKKGNKRKDNVIIYEAISLAFG